MNENEKNYRIKSLFRKSGARNHIFLAFAVIVFEAILLISCSSVFSGGAQGRVVDSESTENPKAGIGDVDVYAYTSSGSRDSDFGSWDGYSRFQPSSDYYAHTSTASDGSFSISKIVWETKKPVFGKDADVSTLYLIFYHENYGLTKGGTLIVSDSTSDTVYQELTKIKKTTTLNLTFTDVATSAATGNSLLVNVLVPQGGLYGKDGGVKKYSTTVTGTGALDITYPRWISEDDKKNEVENQPEVTISYGQSSDQITWKACKNDEEGGDYSFIENPSFTKTVKGDSFNLNFYGKATKVSMPSISGQFKKNDETSPTESDDGLVIKMKAKVTSDGDFSKDCGETTTEALAIGTSGNQSHGNFSGLGNGITWTDESYTGKYLTASLQFYLDDAVLKISGSDPEKTVLEIRSDSNSYTVNLTN